MNQDSQQLNERLPERLTERLTDLEMRITVQDDLVEQLNAVIYEQQKQIDAILKKLAGLEKQSEDPTAPRNEKPPHY